MNAQVPLVVALAVAGESTQLHLEARISCIPCGREGASPACQVHQSPLLYPYNLVAVLCRSQETLDVHEFIEERPVKSMHSVCCMLQAPAASLALGNA